MERPLSVRSCSECAACAVRAGSFAARLDDESLQRLERVRTTRRYQRGQTLYYEDNPCVGVFCMGSAYAKLVKTALHGRNHVLSIAGPGDLLGLESLLIGRPYGHTAEIIAEGVVCLLERSALSQLADARVTFQRAALEYLSGALEQSQTERAQLVGGDVRERTAHAIFTLATKFGERLDGRLLLHVDLSREDLAEIIGVAVETAIRQISDLRRRAIISTPGRSIVVEDPERLARLARILPPADAN